MQSVCTAVNGTTFISNAKMWFQARTLENFLNSRFLALPLSPRQAIEGGRYARGKKGNLGRSFRGAS
jgi:hypothetical protein